PAVACGGVAAPGGGEFGEARSQPRNKACYPHPAHTPTKPTGAAPSRYRELPDRRGCFAQTCRTSGFDPSAGMEVRNTMTEIIDNLRTHGGIARMVRRA